MLCKLIHTDLAPPVHISLLKFISRDSPEWLYFDVAVLVSFPCHV